MLSRIALDDLTGTVTAPKVMLRLALTASTDEALNVNTIKVTAGGTGVDNLHVKSVSLYRDENRNGELDELDTKLGTSQTFDSDNGTVTFTGLAQTIAAGSSEQWMVVYEFVNGSSSMNISAISDKPNGLSIFVLLALMSPLLMVSVLRNSMLRGSMRKMRYDILKRAASFVLIAGLAVFLASCGDNPDAYTAQVDGDLTFKASIASASDIEISGAGGTVDIIGAPIEGDEVTVNFKTSAVDGEVPSPNEPSSNFGIAGSGVGCSLIR